MIKRLIVAWLACTVVCATGYAVADESVSRPDTGWFQDAGFGIFLHWGVYTVAEGRWNGLERKKDLWAEWLRHRAEISKADYEALARKFAPHDFDPRKWAGIFKNSGARYVVITAKHHDGFAMYKSKVSGFNIGEWPVDYNRDIIMDLGNAVRASGLDYGVYYSQKIDWQHEPDWGKKPEKFNDYLENIAMPQVEELLKRYTPLSIMWFDIGLSKQEDALRLEALVRKHSPRTLINSRIGGGISGDYASGGDNEVPPVPKDPPWESCMTLTHHWAHYPQDVYQRSATEVIRTLADIRSKGGNMLLNIGPDKDGNFDARDLVVLRRVGDWLALFGESIYGVGATPLARVPWGCVTRGKDGILYLHVFDMPPAGEVVLPGVVGEVDKAWMLGDPKKKAIEVLPDGDRDHRLVIPVQTVTAKALDASDMVLAVKLAPGAEFDQMYLLQDDLINEFKPATAILSGSATRKHERVVTTIEEDPAIERARHDDIAFLDQEGRLAWSFRTTHAADYHLVIDYAELSERPRVITVTLDGETFSAQLQTTPDDKLNRFRTLRVGTAAIRSDGEHSIAVTVTGGKPGEHVLFNGLRLVPTRTTLLDE